MCLSRNVLRIAVRDVSTDSEGFLRIPTDLNRKNWDKSEVYHRLLASSKIFLGMNRTSPVPLLRRTANWVGHGLSSAPAVRNLFIKHNCDNLVVNLVVDKKEMSLKYWVSF